jgi:hypothetical protein
MTGCHVQLNNAKLDQHQLCCFFFFLNGDGSRSTRKWLSLRPHRYTITDRSHKSGNYNQTCKTVKRIPYLNAKRDQVLLASTKPPTEPLRAGHRTTVGEPGHLGRRGGREACATIEAAERVPYTHLVRSGRRNEPPQAAGENLLEDEPDHRACRRSR